MELEVEEQKEEQEEQSKIKELKEAEEERLRKLKEKEQQRINKEQLSALYNDLNMDMPTDQRPYSAGLKNRLKREMQRLNRNFFPKEGIKIC